MVGGGIAGLTAAYHWAKKGAKVTVLEASNKWGGLLATEEVSIDGKSFYIEYFYHHFFKKDKKLKALLKELGILNTLEFRTVQNNFGNIYNWKDRLLLAGLLGFWSYKPLLGLSLGSYYSKLGGLSLTADNLSQMSGFEKLIYFKFYEDSNDVSLAWLWARLKARFDLRSLLFGEKLGVITPSSKVLVDTLVRRLHQMGVDLKLNWQVKDLVRVVRGRNPSKVIFTIPVDKTARLLGNFIKWRWHVPNYVGALNVVLFFDKSVDLRRKTGRRQRFYWTNLTPQPGFEFLVKVEQDLLNPTLPFRTVYLGAYLPWNHKWWKASEEELLALVRRRMVQLPWGGLRGVRVFKTKYAQHIPSVEYFKNVVPRNLGAVRIGNRKVDVEVFSFGNLVPWDRGVNNAIYGL